MLHELPQLSVEPSDAPQVVSGPAPYHVESIALVTLAAWAAKRRAEGGSLRVDTSLQSPYTWKTGLLKALSGDLPRIRNVRPQSTFAPLSWFAGHHDAEKELGGLVLGLLNMNHARAKQAIGASIKEIAFNAAEHGKSPQRAFFSAGWFPKQRRVTFAIADLGPTIYGHLKRKGLITPEDDDVSAIEKAIQKGVTGAGEVGRTDAPNNAGMGLFMTRAYARGCDGEMLIWSGQGALHVQGHDREEFFQTPTRWPGTVVSVTLKPDQVGTYGDSTHDMSMNVMGVRFNGTPPETALVLRPPIDGVGFAAQKSWYIEHRPAFGAALADGRGVHLDFHGAKYSAQSALHGLLYEPLRDLGKDGARQLWVSGLRGPIEQVLKHVLSYSLRAAELYDEE